MVTINDRALAARVRLSQDRHAFDELVRRHQSQIRNSLRQWLGWNQATADDLAQETFIRAYRTIGSFRQDSSFSTWLYRIAYNNFVDFQRSKPVTQDMESSEDLIIDEPSGNDHTDSQLQRDLARAMLKLSVQERGAIHLNLQRQYSHREIADIMGIPVGTVKTLILRGREKLARQLTKWRI